MPTFTEFVQVLICLGILFIGIKLMDLSTVVSSLKTDVQGVADGVTRVLDHLNSGDTAAAIAELQTIDTQLQGVKSALDAAVPPSGS